MLRDISISNPQELIPWKLDAQLFKERYPSLYLKYAEALGEMDYLDIVEILPAGDSIVDLIKRTVSVVLAFSDRSSQPIYNTDIINWNGLECDGYSIYSDSQFVYFIISRVASQAGSLGIWSITVLKQLNIYPTGKHLLGLLAGLIL